MSDKLRLRTATPSVHVQQPKHADDSRHEDAALEFGPELRPGMLSAADILALQHAVGNQAVQRMLLTHPPTRAPAITAGLGIQRSITVESEKDTYTLASWATKYADSSAARGKEFGKARAALTKIDANNESFKTRDDLFQRVDELVEAMKDKCIMPMWREPVVSRVGWMIDYQFDEVKPIPMMKLAKVYKSNWDKKGGFGAEYVPPENEQKWVIHVHRGKNGGLTSAKVKAWASRGVGHNGSQIFKFANLVTMGIPQVELPTVVATLTDGQEATV